MSSPASEAEVLATLARLAESALQAAAAPAMRPPIDESQGLAEARYRALIEQIPAVTFMASLEGGFNPVYVSPQIQGLLGYSQEEWIGNPVLWFRQLHPDDVGLWNREFARGCAEGGPFRAECRFIARDGRTVWVHGEARLISDERGHPVLLQGVAFDITESKVAAEVVRNSLREKELLLKEIHHRVKNNLQVTSSLLRLQANQSKDGPTRELLRESQDRIRSMALVHEMLYRSEDLAHVNFADYVRSLVVQLFRSCGATNRIASRVEVEPLALGIDAAVPCGLIVNELVANALKHAFPGDRRGTVLVRMAATDGIYRLAVRDDGKGLPAGVDLRSAGTLGLQLVQTLARQLEGRVRIQETSGTEFVVEFPAARGPS